MKRKNKGIIILSLIVLIGLTIFFLLTREIQNDNIKVTGNIKYNDEQVINYIFEDKWDKNPFVLYFKSKYGKQKKIPFVDKYKVSITSFDSVKITVYEKKIIGYVMYMGSNMYFDKDGTVIESSTRKIEDVPLVKGLNFDNIVLNETLPIEDKDILDVILDTTQILQKYKLNVDSIEIDDKKKVIVYMGNIEVLLGKNKDMNEKIRALSDMYDSVKDMKGTLDITEYKEDDYGYTFKKSE